jgi:hypothetical protein
MSMVSWARAGAADPAASAAPPRIVDRRENFMANLVFMEGVSIA